MSEGPDERILSLLSEGRALEKAQTLFYRALAASAEQEGRSRILERLNELHADEQHHLSRLTARLIEFGSELDGLDDVVGPIADLEGWEAAATGREAREVEWYERALEGDMDLETRAVLEEILDSERNHKTHLGGKWMPAS